METEYWKDYFDAIKDIENCQKEFGRDIDPMAMRPLDEERRRVHEILMFYYRLRIQGFDSDRFQTVCSNLDKCVAPTDSSLVAAQDMVQLMQSQEMQYFLTRKIQKCHVVGGILS